MFQSCNNFLKGYVTLNERVFSSTCVQLHVCLKTHQGAPKNTQRHVTKHTMVCCEKHLRVLQNTSLQKPHLKLGQAKNTPSNLACFVTHLKVCRTQLRCVLEPTNRFVKHTSCLFSNILKSVFNTRVLQKMCYKTHQKVCQSLDNNKI